MFVHPNSDPDPDPYSRTSASASASSHTHRLHRSSHWQHWLQLGVQRLQCSQCAEYYDKTECVRDNATGLIWQGQTAAGTGLRANNVNKTNYDSTSALQKYSVTVNSVRVYVTPTQVEIDANTNSIGFKNAVNATNLCGSSAWRLPTKDELLGIVKTSEYPMIDNVWFPNTVSGMPYWTSSPNVDYAESAWGVIFSYGSAFNNFRGYRDAPGGGDGPVRLVR